MNRIAEILQEIESLADEARNLVGALLSQQAAVVRETIHVPQSVSMTTATQAGPSGSTENDPYYCSLCRMRCSGPEALEEHMVGKRHLKASAIIAAKRGT